MRWWVLFYFFVEVVLTVEVGGRIGGLAMFLEIVISAFLGIFIIANLKNSLAYDMQALMRQKLTAEELVAGNLLSLVGALMLIIPGMVSDALGLLLQFEFITHAIGARFKPATPPKKGDENVIDVEIVEHHTTIK